MPNPYIPSSDIQEGAILEIRPLSPYVDRTLLNEKPHRHIFQEIIYLKSGKGFHAIDGKVFKLKAHTIYLIRQGQVHDFLEGDDLKGYLLRYKETILPPELTIYSTNYSLLQMVTDVNSLTLTKKEAKVFNINFKELLNEVTENINHEADDIIRFILLTILCRINQKIRNTSEQHIIKENDPNSAIYQRLILLVEDYYKTEHELSFYCLKLGVNTRKLLAITQAKAGMTPKQIINKRLIIEAKRLLRFTDFSLKEIAFDLGYTEPAYFSRVFKRKIGVSPKHYRAQ